jgi:hypothetical protein
MSKLKEVNKMRKVNCTVIYKYTVNGYKVLNITVKHNNENTMLYSKMDFALFTDMYKHILIMLKNNNFYVNKWKMFDTVFYDIDFIDIDTAMVNRYPLHN